MKRLLAFGLLVALFVTGCQEITVSPDPTGELPQNGEVEQTGFTGGNIGAGGLMGGDGEGWVFYRSEADGWRLYKATLDGNDKVKLSDDYPSLINVLDGWVYYASFLDGFSIYRIRIDGTERQKLVEGYCDNLFVAESGMYFDMRDVDGYAQVYFARHDGTGMQLLVPNMRAAYYHGGIVYCNDAEKVYAYDLVTGSLELVVEGYVHNVTVTGGAIYYWLVDENVYCRKDLDGGKVEVLTVGGDYYNFSTGELYYQGYGGHKNDYVCIYRVDMETGEISVALKLSDQYFDGHGELLGVTLVQMREGSVELDDSMFLEDGSFVGYSESADYTYAIEGQTFTRGSLRSSLVRHGRLDCWILLDGGSGIVWD